jgi:Mce-associated membrane protein
MMTDDEPSADDTDTAADGPDEPIQTGDDDAPVNGTPSPLIVAARRAAGWSRSNVRPIVLIALVIAAGGLAAGVYYSVHRPDREIDHAAADQVIRAASDGAVAALSYSSDSLDRDIANAKLHLTGNFLEYYTKFTRDVVAPAVREKHLNQQATIVRAAVSQLHPDSAVVLTYVNETTKSAERKDPLTTPSVVRLTLQKVDGNWLISKLDPIG